LVRYHTITAQTSRCNKVEGRPKETKGTCVSQYAPVTANGSQIDVAWWRWLDHEKIPRPRFEVERVMGQLCKGCVKQVCGVKSSPEFHRLQGPINYPAP